jgi:hypothetical protein
VEAITVINTLCENKCREHKVMSELEPEVEATRNRKLDIVDYYDRILATKLMY